MLGKGAAGLAVPLTAIGKLESRLTLGAGSGCSRVSLEASSRFDTALSLASALSALYRRGKRCLQPTKVVTPKG